MLHLSPLEWMSGDQQPLCFCKICASRYNNGGVHSKLKQLFKRLFEKSRCNHFLSEGSEQVLKWVFSCNTLCGLFLKKMGCSWVCQCQIRVSHCWQQWWCFACYHQHSLTWCQQPNITYFDYLYTTCFFITRCFRQHLCKLLRKC
jgi:hypothetical protein